MTLAIRRARAGDAAGIALASSASFLETFADDHPGQAILDFLAEAHSESYYTRKLIDGHASIFVADGGAGGLVGMALLEPPNLPGTSPSDLQLSRLYLLWRWAGTGTGRALHDAVEAEARARGAQRLVLSVYERNHRARRFYEKCGYVLTGDAYEFDTAGFMSTDVVMAKPL